MRSGTHSSASPSFFARRASIVLPVSSRSSAAGAPASRGSSPDPAPSRNDAQHHFWQTEARRRLVDDHAVATGERKLEAPAQTEAADERQCRVRRARDALEGIPTALDQRARRPRLMQVAELVDIGAGDEAARLARADHQPTRRIACERIEDFVQLGKRRGRQRIGRGPRLVEDEPRNAVRIPADFPMFQGALSRAASADPLDQHRAALATTDADRRDAAPAATALEHVQ